MNQPAAIADQLLLLTLTALQALDQDDMQELEATLADRGQLLGSLEPGALATLPAATAAKISAADSRLRRALETQRATLLLAGEQVRSDRQARTAYAKTG